MDGPGAGSAVNGSKGSGRSNQNQNEAKEKVNKTLLLKQQIEENRQRMLLREQERTNTKRNLEQLFTQLDKSASSASLNMSLDVEDPRDTKIVSLESTISNLKSEKQKLELHLLSLETIQESKECLEIEMQELRSTHDQILIENNILQSKVHRLHELEDENDELKAKIDRFSYENSSLQQDLEVRDRKVSALELKLLKMRQEVEESSAKSSAIISASQEEFQKQLNDLLNERQKLQQECESLQLKLVELETKAEVLPTPEVKVATLGAKKKQRAKKEKTPASGDVEKKDVGSAGAALQAQIEALTAQRDALETANANLKTVSRSLEEKLAESVAEGQTLQQRVHLLMSELQTDNGPNNDLTNLQTILCGKEKELADLSNELLKVQSEKSEVAQRLEEADNELFKYRAKCKDSDYLLNSKEDKIRELEMRLQDQPSMGPPAVSVSDTPLQTVKVSSLGAKKKTQQRKGKGGRSTTETAPQETEPSQDKAAIVALNEEIATLKQKIEDSDAEKYTLSQRVQLLMAEIQSNDVFESSDKVELGAQVTFLNQELTYVRQKLADVEEEKHALDQRVKFLLVELETYQGNQTFAAADQETRILSLSEQVLSLEGKLAQSESEKSTLQQRVELLLIEIESNENQGDELNEVKETMRDKEAEVGELRRKISDESFKLNAEIHDLRYTVDIKDKKVSKLQCQLEEAAKEIERTRDVVTNLETKLRKHESIVSEEEKSSSGTVSHLQEALHQARKELSKADGEVSTKSEAIKQLEKSCANLNREMSEMRLENRKLKEDLAEAEVVLAEKDAKLKNVQDELNRMKVRADEEGDRSAIEEERNQLQMDNEVLRNDLTTRNSQLDECKGCAERLEREMREACSTIETLNTSLEAASSQKASVEEKFNQLTEKFKKLAANYKQKLQVIQQLEAKLEKMKEAVGNDDSANVRLKLVEGEAEIETLRSQLERAKEEALNARKDIQKLKETAEESARLAETHRQLEGQNRALRDQIAVMEQSPDELEPFKLAIQRAEDELAASQDQLRTTQEELQQVMGESRKLLEQLDASNNRVTQLEEQLVVQRELDDHLKLKEHQLSEISGQLQEACTARDAFQRHIEELKKELDCYAETSSNLQQNFKDLWHNEQQLRASNVHLEEELERSRNQLENASFSQQSEVARERDAFQEQINAMNEEIHRLKNDLGSAQWELNEKNGQISELLEQKESSQRQFSELQERIAQSSCNMGALNSELSILRDKVVQLEQDLAVSNNQYANLYSTFGAMEHEKTTLQNHLADASLRVDQLTEELGGLKTTNGYLVSRSSDLEQEMQVAKDLRQQLTDLNLINSQLLGEIADLKNRLEESERLFHDALAEKDRAQELTKQELKNVKQQSDELEHVVQEKNDDISTLREVLDGKDRLLEQTKSALESIRREKEDLARQLWSKDEELSTTQIMIGEKDRSLVEVKSELERQLWSKDEELATIQNVIGEKDRSLEQIKHELESLKQSSAQLEQSLQQKDSEITAFQDSFKNKEQLMEQLRSSEQAMLIERQDMEKRFESMANEVFSLKDQVQELRSINDEALQVRAELERQLKQLETEKEEVLKRLKQLEQEKLAVDEELRQGRKSLEQQSKMAADVQEIGQLRVRLADLTDERDDLSYQLEDVQAQCSSAEMQLSEARETCAALQANVAVLELRVGQLQSENASLNAGKLDLESAYIAQLEALKLEHDGLTTRLEEVGTVREEVVSLKADLDIARQLNRQLEDRAQSMERQLSDAMRCLGEEEKKRRHLQDERDDLSNKMSDLSSQLANLETMHLEQSALATRLADQQHEMERYESMALLYEQYKIDAEEAVKLRRELDELKRQAEEVTQLRVKVFDAMSEKEELESNIQSLEDDLSSANSELEWLRSELHNSKVSSADSEELKKLTGEVAQLRLRLFEAVTAKDELESSVQSLEEELEIARDEVIDMKKKLEEERNTSAELEAAQQELESVRSALEANQSALEQVEKLRDELANVRSQMAQLAHDRSLEVAALEAERASNVDLAARCADLDMERNLLAEKCMELRDTSAAFEAKCIALEARKAESSSLQPAQLEELGQLRMAVIELTTEREDVEEKLAEAGDRLAEMAALSVTNSELSMELDEARERIRVLEHDHREQIDQLKKRLADAVQKVATFEERVDRVSLERDQLQQTVQRLEEEVPVRVEKAQMETQEKSSNDDQNDDALKQKIAALETELHETKIKAAKSLRQVKMLKAELAKAKEESAKRAAGDDFFTQVVEDELQKKVSDAEKAAAEKVKETQRLLMRIDTLEAANERFLAAKERQDNEVAMLEQRIRELQAKITSLEWDQPEVREVEQVAKQQEVVSSSPVYGNVAHLEATISQLTDDNEHYQDLLEELKTERQASEVELKERISALEQDLAEKSRLLDEISQQVDNKDKLLADAYESVSQLRKQVMQLSEGFGGANMLQLDELKRENENLIDMIRQLATTGTLDEATIRRLREEISQTTGVELEQLHQSTDSGESHIDWRSAFNDLQIEVEYLRSQNGTLLNRLQEAGLVWEDGHEPYPEGNGRIESLRIQLDNAVRDVHERDVRCQELTWEITKLLEERDTLQLRLSNALRQNHEMQQELKDYIATASGDSPIGDIAIKLRELKQLNYALDVQLRREQEERQTIERQLMALYGSRGGSSSPGYVNGARRTNIQQTERDVDGSGQDFDVNSYQDPATGQVLSEWLKGKGPNIQHI